MSKEVQKWADSAMFTAEPLKASDGPKVYLVWMTPDPLGAVAAMAKMYKGEVVRSLADVTHAERYEYLEQILKTKLKAPLEAVKLHFMVEGVTRSFTHQMVRQRTAVYAQESLRFAVKEDMAEGVAHPPSLAGTIPAVDWYDQQSELPEEERDHFTNQAGNAQLMRNEWDEGVRQVGYSYKNLIDMGMPAEDARGLLPHNITTRLNYVTDLRALLDHAGNRLCTQAQFEWRLVFAKMAEAIREYKPHAALIASAGRNLDEVSISEMEHLDRSDRWQFEALAQIFKPVCYLTGKCEFMADFDRACSIRDRVQANHAIGRPSNEWDTKVDGSAGHTEFIGDIQPAEWLLDPGAAR